MIIKAKEYKGLLRNMLNIPTLQMFASRVQPGLQILSAANFVCNLCNRYLKLLQLFASAVLWCKDSCKYLQSLQIKVAYLTTKVSCNHWLQQLHPECNWTRNTSKSCSFGNPNIYSVPQDAQELRTKSQYLLTKLKT